MLIPIRLDVDVDGYRYIDSFSWNLCVCGWRPAFLTVLQRETDSDQCLSDTVCSYEKDYTYESFADTLVRDLDLPDSFRKRIVAQIDAQVEKGKRSMPWHEAVEASESLHPIFINIRINDTILIDRFEVRGLRDSPMRLLTMANGTLSLSLSRGSSSGISPTQTTRRSSLHRSCATIWYRTAMLDYDLLF